MDNLKIFLVEDDTDIRNLIKLQLEIVGHQVICSSDGATALSMIDHNDFDLFILDRMLPVHDGIYICKYLRNNKKFKNHPILMVTALGGATSIIEGLDAGADDYIGKPFDLNILMARVRCLARRVPRFLENTSQDEMVFGPFKMVLSSYRFFLNKQEVSLTKSEFGLFAYLMKNIGGVLSREELKKEIQGGDVFVTDRTIDTHIFGLRKKLGPHAALVESVRGIGYRLIDKI